MEQKKILYISGSVGLGHITRDLAITEQLRKKHPNLQIDWLAKPPASIKLESKGENILEEAKQISNETTIAEKLSKDYKLNLSKYAIKSLKAWYKNIKTFKAVTSSHQYDLIIGDETYELALAHTITPSIKKSKFAMIYDFVGMNTLSNNPMEKLVTYIVNAAWSRDIYSNNIDLSLFIGEPEDIPDEPFGTLLPGRREYANKKMQYTGYIIPNKEEKIDAKDLKTILGYGGKPLVLCTVGGTSIGSKLIDLCIETSHILKEYEFSIICGPRIDPDGYSTPSNVHMQGYLDKFYSHLAACDLALTHAGGTTTMELAYLGKPFAYFPIKGHFEQEVHVSNRLKRIGAGQKMHLDRVSDDILAKWIRENIGKNRKIQARFDGAETAAKELVKLL